MAHTDLNYCSFCGKHEKEVVKLIQGPAVQICDECVDLCDTVCRETVQGYIEKRAKDVATLTYQG